MHNFLKKNQLAVLFNSLSLPPVGKVVNVLSGKYNDVQIINDKYVVKTSTTENLKFLQKELYCLTILHNRLVNIPRIYAEDIAGTILKRPLFIMSRLPGSSLFAEWQYLSGKEQKGYVKNIAGILQEITQIDPAGNPEIFPRINNWQDWIDREFTDNLNYCCSLKIINAKEYDLLQKKFAGLRKNLLQQNMKLMYYDINFNNFLIDKGKLSGIIDFERIDFVSADYSLNWVKRMVDYPDEYVTNEFRGKLQPQKFQTILNLFAEYYPELFAFKNLESRLAVYAIISYLRVLGRHPKNLRAKERLLKQLAEL